MHKKKALKPIYLYISIFLLAFILRLVYLLQIKGHDPLFYYPIMDPLYHHNWAVSIAQGDWIGKESFFRAPLYPYFLGIIYTLFGINLFIPRLIQSIIGALSCVIVERIGTSLFNRKVGMIAGIVTALYPLLIYFDNELLIPSLLIFLVLLGFYALIKQAKNGGTKLTWLLTGIVWGMAAIARPNILVFLAFLPIWLYKTFKKNFVSPLVFGAIGTLLVIMPVTFRNYMVSKEFVLIAWQGGVNFYIGNNAQSDGKTAIIPGTKKSWYGGYYDAIKIAEEAAGHKLKNSEVDRFWFNKGIEFIRENPGKALLLFLKKIYLFFGGYEIPNNRDLYYFTRPTFLKFIFFKLPFFQFPFGILLPLALAGTWFGFKKKISIAPILYFILPFSFSFVVFFVCARYRMAIVPFLIILASIAVDAIVSDWKHRYKISKIPIMLFTLSLVFFNANLTGIKDNPALNDFTVGSVEFRKRNFAKALSYFEKALPYYDHDVEFLGVMASCYFELKKFKESYQYYYQITLLDPENADAYNGIGSIFYMSKQLGKARECFAEAIKINPGLSIAYFNIANVYYQMDSLEKALQNFESAIALKVPNLADAFYYAGAVEYRLGHPDRALLYLQKALAIDPQHAGARQGIMSLRKK